MLHPPPPTTQRAPCPSPPFFWPPCSPACQRAQLIPLPRWLNFRNNWGAFWALRILNRINETAKLSHWPIQLTWSGFVPTEPADLTAIATLDDPTRAHITQTLDTLLRRFERLPPI